MGKILFSDIHAGLLKVKADVMIRIVGARRERGVYASSYAGICDAFSFAAEMRSNVLYPGFKAWPKFSGSLHYPIPGGVERYRNSANHDRMWVGKYGSLRLELLDFLIWFYGERTK